MSRSCCFAVKLRANQAGRTQIKREVKNIPTAAELGCLCRTIQHYIIMCCVTVASAVTYLQVSCVAMSWLWIASEHVGQFK